VLFTDKNKRIVNFTYTKTLQPKKIHN